MKRRRVGKGSGEGPSVSSSSTINPARYNPRGYERTAVSSPTYLDDSNTSIAQVALLLQRSMRGLTAEENAFFQQPIRHSILLKTVPATELEHVLGLCNLTSLKTGEVAFQPLRQSSLSSVYESHPAAHATENNTNTNTNNNNGLGEARIVREHVRRHSLRGVFLLGAMYAAAAGLLLVNEKDRAAYEMRRAKLVEADRAFQSGSLAHVFIGLVEPGSDGSGGPPQLMEPWLPMFHMERVVTKDQSEARCYRFWLHLYTDAMVVFSKVCEYLAQRFCEDHSFVNGLGHTRFEIDPQDLPENQAHTEKTKKTKKQKKQQQQQQDAVLVSAKKAALKKRKRNDTQDSVDDLDTTLAGLDLDATVPREPASPGLVRVYDEEQEEDEAQAAEQPTAAFARINDAPGQQHDDDDDDDMHNVVSLMQARENSPSLPDTAAPNADAENENGEEEEEAEEADEEEGAAVGAEKDEAAYNQLGDQDEDEGGAGTGDADDVHERAPARGRKRGVTGAQFHYKYGHDWDNTPAERRKSDRLSPLHHWETELLSFIRETWNRDSITASEVRELLEPELIGSALEYTTKRDAAAAATATASTTTLGQEPSLDDQYYKMGVRQTLLVQERFVSRDWKYVGVPDNTKGSSGGGVVALRTIHPGYIFPGHALSAWCDSTVNTRQLYAGSYYRLPFAGRLQKPAMSRSASAPMDELVDQTVAPFADILGTRTPHPLDAVMALAMFGRVGTAAGLPAVQPETLGELFKGYPNPEHVFVLSPVMCQPWNLPIVFLPPPVASDNPTVDIQNIANWDSNTPTGISAHDALRSAFAQSPTQRAPYLYHLLKWATRYIVPMPYASAFDPNLEAIAPRAWGWYEQHPQLTSPLTNTILFGSKWDIKSLSASPANHARSARHLFQDYCSNVQRAEDGCDVSPTVLGLLLCGRQLMRYMRALSEPMYKYWQSCTNYEALSSSYGLRILQAQHNPSAAFGFDIDKAKTHLGEMDWPGWFDADATQGDHIGQSEWSRFLERTRQTNLLLFSHLQHSTQTGDTPIIEMSTFLTRIRTWNNAFQWRGAHLYGYVPETVARKRHYMQGRLYDRVYRRTLSMGDIARDQDLRAKALETTRVGPVSSSSSALSSSTPAWSDDLDYAGMSSAGALGGGGGGGSSTANALAAHQDPSRRGSGDAAPTGGGAGSRAGPGPQFEPMLPPDASYFENNGWFQVGALCSEQRDNIEAFRCCTNWNNFLAAFQTKHVRFLAQLVEPLEAYLLSTRVVVGGGGGGGGDDVRAADHTATDTNRRDDPFCQLERARVAATTSISIISLLGLCVALNNTRPLYMRKTREPPERRPLLPKAFASALSFWELEYSRLDAISHRFPFRENFDRWGSIDTVYGCLDRMITEAFMRKGIGEGNTQHMVGFGKTLWCCAIASSNMENRDDDTAGVSVMCSGGTGEGKTKVIETMLQLLVPETWTMYSGLSKNALNVEENHDGTVEFMDEGFAKIMSTDSKVADEEVLNEWKFMLSHGFLKKRRLVKTESGKLVPENAWAARKTTVLFAQNMPASSEKALMARFTQLAARTIVSDRTQPLHDTLPAHAAQMASMDTDVRCDQDEQTLFGPRMLHSVKMILEMLIHCGVLKTETERVVTYTNSLLDPFKPGVSYQGKMARVHINLSRLIRSEVTNYAAMAILMDYALHHDELGRFGGRTSVPYEFIVAAAPKYLYAVTAHAVKAATALFYTLVDNQEHFNVARGLVAAARHNLTPDAPHVRFLVEQVPRGQLAVGTQLSVNQTRIKEQNPHVTWSDDFAGSSSLAMQSYLGSGSAIGGAGGGGGGGDNEEMIAVLNMNYVVIDFPNANTAKQFYAALKKHLPPDGTYDEGHLPPIVAQLAELEYEVTEEADMNSSMAYAYNSVARRVQQAHASIQNNPQVFYGEPFSAPPQPPLSRGSGAAHAAAAATTTIAMTPPGTPGPVVVATNSGRTSAARGDITSAFRQLPHGADTFAAIEGYRGHQSAADRFSHFRSSFNWEPGMAITLQTAAECGLPLRRYDYHERNRSPLVQIFAHVPAGMTKTGGGGGGGLAGGDGGSGGGGSGGGGRSSFRASGNAGRKHRVAVYYGYLKTVLGMMRGSGSVTSEELDMAEVSHFVQYETLCRPMKGSMIASLEEQLFKTEQRNPYPEFVHPELYKPPSSSQDETGANAEFLSESMPTTIMANATSGYVAQFTEAVVHKVFDHPASAAIAPSVAEFLRSLKMAIRRIGAMMTVTDTVQARYGSDEYRVSVNRSQMARFATTLTEFERALSTRRRLPTLESVDSLNAKGLDRFTAAVAEAHRQKHRIRQGTRVVSCNVDAESYLAYCAKCRPPRDPCDPSNYMSLPLCYKRGMTTFLESVQRVPWAVQLAKRRRGVEHALSNGNVEEIGDTTYPLMDYNYQLKRHLYVLVVQQFRGLGPMVDDFDPTVFCTEKTPAKWLRETALAISRAYQEQQQQQQRRTLLSGASVNDDTAMQVDTDARGLQIAPIVAPYSDDDGGDQDML